MSRQIVRRRGWVAALVAFAMTLPTIAAAAGTMGGPDGEERIQLGIAPILGPDGEERHQPDIVLLLTDDMRSGMLRYMPNVRRLLVEPGVRFDNGYVVNPVCCPSRASILTGGNSHTTGVYSNRGPYGGFGAFRDTSTIATRLQDAGYRTGLFGKYFNGYRRTTYVPPGWDRWFATYDRESGYYGYTAVSDGVEMHYGSDPEDYGQTVLRREAVDFIRDTDASQPLFMYWATHAPHAPATPERRDRTAFSDLAPWRPPNYDEADVSDKPTHVRSRPPIDMEKAREIDAFRLDQIRALQSVDHAVKVIVDTLRDAERLEDTIIVFMSDNGMLWGEHRLQGKGEIYEEAISVPLVVRYDALIDRARSDDHLVLNIDIAPTFAELAGVDLPNADGRSLLPLLSSHGAPWRDAFLIEHLHVGGERLAPTFCAVHTERYVLVRYGNGEEELYDLARDPHQMQNRAGLSRYADRRSALRAQLRNLCDPLPPGFSF